MERTRFPEVVALKREVDAGATRQLGSSPDPAGGLWDTHVKVPFTYLPQGRHWNCLLMAAVDTPALEIFTSGLDFFFSMRIQGVFWSGHS